MHRPSAMTELPSSNVFTPHRMFQNYDDDDIITRAHWANCTVKALRLRIMMSLLTEFRVILIDRAPLKRLHQIAGLGTPPLLEGKLLLLHESWSGSEERPSKFFGALKGGEFPSSICISSPLHRIRENSLKWQCPKAKNWFKNEYKY